MRFSLHARVAAEFVGTAFLLMAVVGSGIMGERLSAGNVAVALLANTIATSAALVALILTFGPVSGAHLNPAVTLADASQRGIPWHEVPGYVIAQILGAYVGVIFSANVSLAVASGMKAAAIQSWIKPCGTLTGPRPDQNCATTFPPRTC